MHDPATDAERLIRCFDPSVVLVEGASEILILSPRFGRIRRRHPLLASAPAHRGAGHLWQAAHNNLLTCTDRSVQLAIRTYEYRIRMRARVSFDSLRHAGLDLHLHCHRLLDGRAQEKAAAPIRRENFWIRSVTCDTAGHAEFEFGNTFLAPISESAITAEARTLIGAPETLIKLFRRRD